MSKSLNLQFEEVFKISTKSLRFNDGHPDVVRDRVWIIRFSILFSIVFITNLCLIYSIFFHDIKAGRFSDASKNGAMVIVYFTFTLKYFILIIYQKVLQNLIKFIDTDYSDDNDYSEEDKQNVRDYSEKGVNVCKFFLYAGYSTCTIFPMKAFVSMAYYYFKGNFKLVTMFEVSFFEPIESNKNTAIVFWTWFSMAMLFDLYVATTMVGFDPFIPICMLHVCGQIAILTRRLNKIFNELEDTREMEIQLRIIAVKLQSLYEFIDTINAHFGILFEMNMKGTTFALPLTAFQILEELRRHWVSVEFIVFFWASVVHFFVPCYYSDLLMEDSENFRQAIYASGWEKCPNKSIRQTILLMLTRARVPMGIRSVFYEISLDTFAEMCRQAYGFLNLMNATWG